MKRKKLNVFSLSFLDIITCGLGAVILLFVLVNARSTDRRNEVTSDLRAEVQRLETRALAGQKKLVALRNSLKATTAELVQTRGLSRQVLKVLQARKIELADSQNDTLARRQHVNRLKSDLKSLEEDVKRLRAGARAREAMGTRLRPFPGHGDRQYLTDLKMGGRRIFILVDASASMLDDTIVGIIRRRNLPDPEKLKSAKWRQAVATVDWLTTQLPPNAQFQVYTFNETAGPLLTGSRGRWLKASDVDQLNQTVARLQRAIPAKGTSLVNAFTAMDAMQPAPDNIFLLTDGLPTMGTGRPWRERVSGDKRLSLFNQAIRRLPARVPVNVILYPMEGDPLAAISYWRLAVDSKGSFFCPSRDWP